MKAGHLLKFGVLAALLAGNATAEETNSGSLEDHAAARELMRQGNALYAAGDVRNAYAQYEAAWTRAKGFDVACNLGRAAGDLGRSRDAAEYLDYCLRHYSLSSREDVVQAEHEVRAALGRAKAAVGTLTIRAEPTGAEIFVDGTSMGRDPLDAPLFVEPGAHRVRADAAGHTPAESSVSASAGTESEVRLSLAPSVSVAATPVVTSPRAPDVKEATSHPSYGPALTAGAFAVTSLAVGVGFFVAAANKDADKDHELATLSGTDRCGFGTANAAACGRIVTQANDAKGFRTVSFVSFGLAAAGAAVAVFLWPRSEHAVARGFQVFPVVGVGNETTGLAASGSF